LENTQIAQEMDVGSLIKAIREEHSHVECTTYIVRGNPVPLTITALGSRMLGVGAYLHRGPLSVEPL
jgi:hypothetical protein